MKCIYYLTVANSLKISLFYKKKGIILVNSQDRITELEIKLAFTEKLVSELNEVLISQNNRIDSLIVKVEKHEEALTDLSPGHIKRSSEESPPPHY